MTRTQKILIFAVAVALLLACLISCQKPDSQDIGFPKKVYVPVETDNGDDFEPAYGQTLNIKEPILPGNVGGAITSDPT